jgi:hypothetical protein
MCTTIQVTGISREGDPKGWSMVLVTALGSLEKPVPHGHGIRMLLINVVNSSNELTG